MTDERWHVLAEFTSESSPDGNQQMMERLAAAVSELNLSWAFLERMQAAMIGATRKAFDHQEGHAAPGTVVLRVLVSGLEPDDGKTQPSWGFFYVEKDMAIARHTIELFLYQDGKQVI